MANQRPRERWGLPIRFKIWLLIVVALLTSLACYISAGTSLVIQDKISYVYDYNLAQVRNVSDHLQSRLTQARAVLTMLGSLADSRLPGGGASTAESVFKQRRELFEKSGVLVLRPADKLRYENVFRFSEKPDLLESLIARLGWTPDFFETHEMATSSEVGGALPLAVRMLDAEAKPLVAVTLMEIGPDVLDGAGRGFRLQLVDEFGKPMIATPGFQNGVGVSELSELQAKLSRQPFASGAIDLNGDPSPFVAAYQRVPGTGIFVLGMISKTEAFRAVGALRQRALVLGLGILLVATALTLALSRSLTTRIRGLWRATLKMSEGDFSIRVPEGGGRDEIAGLACSFNLMAGRIGQLMTENVTKARMEKELETAQAVQRAFSPGQTFRAPNITLAGRAMSATECAGDWWSYAQIGNYLVIAIGDVTGHGVSSALVTAAAHGAFSIIISTLSEDHRRTGSEPSLSLLMRQLNLAVRSASHGESSMTLFACTINVDTGVISWINAGHCNPYIRRPPAGIGDPNPLKAFVPLVAGLVPALGREEEISPAVTRATLQPGDVIFWYTDGLLECRNPSEKALGKRKTLTLFDQISTRLKNDAEGVCSELLREFREFLGTNAANPDDDTTLVVASIPANAVFATALVNDAAAVPAANQKLAS